MNARVTFHGISPADRIEAEVRRRIENLAHFYDRIVACDVAIERPHRHQRKGEHFRVRVGVTIPKGELVAGREPAAAAAHADLMVAIRDAFVAVRRELREYVRARRLVIRSPRAFPARARVRSIFPEKGFGFLETDDGREIYFHRNSVLKGAFDRLKAGDLVRFSEEPGEKGPQATTVARASRHRLDRRLEE